MLLWSAVRHAFVASPVSVFAHGFVQLRYIYACRGQKINKSENFT